MLCPLSYAPTRPDIRGERLTLLTRIVGGRLRVGLPVEVVDCGAVHAPRRVRSAVSTGAARRVAVPTDVDRARGGEQAADEQQFGAALDDGDPDDERRRQDDQRGQVRERDARCGEQAELSQDRRDGQHEDARAECGRRPRAGERTARPAERSDHRGVDVATARILIVEPVRDVDGVVHSEPDGDREDRRGDGVERDAAEPHRGGERRDRDGDWDERDEPERRAAKQQPEQHDEEHRREPERGRQRDDRRLEDCVGDSLEHDNLAGRDRVPAVAVGHLPGVGGDLGVARVGLDGVHDPRRAVVVREVLAGEVVVRRIAQLAVDPV